MNNLIGLFLSVISWLIGWLGGLAEGSGMGRWRELVCGVGWWVMVGCLPGVS